VSKRHLYTHTEVDYGLRRCPIPTSSFKTKKWLGVCLLAVAGGVVLKMNLSSSDVLSAPAIAIVPDTTDETAIIIASQELVETAMQPDNAHMGEPALSAIELPVALSPVPHQIKMPEVKAAPIPSERTVSINIRRGDTVAKIFDKQGFDSVLLHDIMDNETVSHTLTKIHPGETIDFVIDPNNELLRLEYNASELERLVVDVDNGKPSAKIVEREIEELLTFANATIDDSLFMAADREGLDQNITMELARIFGWDIDFALDIHKGDTFSVIYEARYVDGEKISPGDIVAAEFVNQGKTYRAIRYETADGKADYYTPEGHSMRKAFIRTPVEFARVSSKFNPHRRHPILHTIRAHKGVDYAAARGTPVRATGDGVISAANNQNGYGKVVEIQHGSAYSTLYAHLNGFAPSIKKGKSVKQGDIIGYVGMTGMATGPHLHYEFRINGKHVDPLTVELPNSDPIHAKHRPQFLAHVSGVLKQLSNYQSIELAAAKPENVQPKQGV
jgi:murein DD-endopeptidase MepM/ murein hydrolase activator NlpD